MSGLPLCAVEFCCFCLLLLKASVITAPAWTQSLHSHKLRVTKGQPIVYTRAKSVGRMHRHKACTKGAGMFVKNESKGITQIFGPAFSRCCCKSQL